MIKRGKIIYHCLSVHLLSLLNLRFFFSILFISKRYCLLISVEIFTLNLRKTKNKKQYITYEQKYKAEISCMVGITIDSLSSDCRFYYFCWSNHCHQQYSNNSLPTIKNRCPMSEHKRIASTVYNMMITWII